MQDLASHKHKNGRLRKAQETREEEAHEMQQAVEERTEGAVHPQSTEGRDNPTLGDILGQPTRRKVASPAQNGVHEDCLMLQMIRDNYNKDPLTQTVLTNPDNHRQHFHVVDGMPWTKNFCRAEVICIPRENS
jgi:hypothetical protein